MMVSSAATAARATPAAQTNMVAAFNGLKSTSAFPVTRKPTADFSKLPSNGGRVQCMKVWPIEGVKKFETLSYLPPLTIEQLLKQVEYLLRSNWIPCLEFCKVGFVSRDYSTVPTYYDGRYWTMWKLPMFGCTDAVEVVKELDACKAEYPDAFIRIIGFDNNRQVQCISFIAYKPPF
ncbi:ribulose-1,5-bisphosphate carboxylase small subunit [Alcaligenes ammonioxydans]|uniref:ribulose-1,5-bisphosphate carboxylase small subunit n=1 Tax=Alcaligenes ammonioxydans TaxID=2582914 RepID=UPI001F05B6FE|nr:ribulose-1,5-bisphosphate carboxylase small subunit [Alcaligenes ammonioxydans]MCH1881319.1 ribulose-1,5-bisphosphate carboxylase small subunit [Alcaligenes ammonioxydans]